MQNESGTSEGTTPAEMPGASSSANSAQPGKLKSRSQAGFLKVLKFWNRIAPFFVSAALFLSGFFAIFSPLPFLILGVTGNPRWVWAALATNSALVYLSSGSTVFQFYLLSVGTIGLVMPFLIFRRFKPEAVVARTWIVQWCLVAMLIGVYAILRGVTPWEELKRIFASFFDLLMVSLPPESREQLIQSFGGGKVGVEEWRKATLTSLPGNIGILCLLLAWFNLRVLFNLNPNRFLSRVGLDRRTLNRWKSADWLIWPTLGSWAVVLFTEGTPSDVALNIFKVFMAAYGIQGFAVLGSLFDAYKVRGLFRILLYSLVLIVIPPLLLSVGFFDQWFDFRTKFRQT